MQAGVERIAFSVECGARLEYSVQRIVKKEEKEEDKIQRPIFLCHSHESGNPGAKLVFSNRE